MKRRAMMGGLAALALAAGGAVFTLRPAGHHYPPTPYDDVLAKVTDREWAAKFGPAAMAAMPDFTPARGAARLRGLLKGGTLAAAAQRDLNAGHVLEAGGWLVPESVVLAAALAKSAASAS